MREFVLVTTVDLSAELLWAAAADLTCPTVPQDRIPRFDSGRVVVARAVPPDRLVVITGSFLAGRETSFLFTSLPRGTRIEVAVRAVGPLGFALRGLSHDRLSTLVEWIVRRAGQHRVSAMLSSDTQLDVNPADVTSVLRSSV